MTGMSDARDPAAGYSAVRHDVGLVDRSDWGVIEVTGRDRAAFLHALLSNDVKSLAPGEGCAAALLDVHGRVHAFMAVLALEDRILMPVLPGLAAPTVEMLDKHLFSEKAYLRDATGDFALFLLAGPNVPSLIERLTGAALPERAWSHASAGIAGVEARIVRGGGESGEVEAWVMCASAEGTRVHAALTAAGARPVDREAWEALRIETGTPAFGADADESVLLPEVPFVDRVSYTKGCYLGQEVVVRIRDRGHVNRTLTALVIDGEAIPSRGARIVADGTDAGHVTSAAWSWALKRPIALGLVRRQHAEPGTRVSIVLDAGASVAATVSSVPLPR
jgi:folate-binding protein YgfZ